jgi:hypothetical protein
MPTPSRETREHMQAVTKDLPTKSAKIRALSASGYKRQEIADFLGIRYQHVRNVLLQPLAQRAGSAEPAEHPGVKEEAPAPTADGGEASRPTSGNLLIERDGRVSLPSALRHDFGWKPGRRVFWVREHGTIRLFSEEAALQFAQALVARHAGSGGNVVDDFLKERRDEARREDRG